MPHPDVIVAADPEALARAAAERNLARLRRSSGRSAVSLTGGSTPEHLYELLATKPYRDALSWNRIHWFWGDDRFVPHNYPRSNFGVAAAARSRSRTGGQDVWLAKAPARFGLSATEMTPNRGSPLLCTEDCAKLTRLTALKMA
jgi:hypothetical protein